MLLRSSSEKTQTFARVPPRVAIEALRPEIDAGRFPISRIVGEQVGVEADLLVDGHQVLAGVVLFRHGSEETWREVSLRPAINDRWVCEFVVDRLGTYEYTVEAWIDGFASWRRDLEKKSSAGQEVSSDLLEGLEFVRQRADLVDSEQLRQWGERLAGAKTPTEGARLALNEELALLMERHPDRRNSAHYDRVLRVTVERERARYGAWYELFPRSCSAEPGRHGTFRDVESWLPYVAGMGFDVLYLPPIHPIGRTHRKGPNNSLVAGPNDPGSPWAIGATEGGHKAVHPELGTLNDFDLLVAAARAQGLEIALDMAFQCSPDHPYVREHPEWFSHRPDGSIKYAENPPKKYQDIYPLNFECADWPALWDELKSVILFWIARGVTIFRIDNPHTKPFRFWEWLIQEVQREHPETVFLAEAFTRPKVMRHLAKSGFSQSYTYFTWRTQKAELMAYLQELTLTEMRESFSPNFFANTPDILHASLQFGGRVMFEMRLILAATLSASYGIYGPPFELCEHLAALGKEEYVDNEKYQLRHWNREEPGSLRDLITLVNRIRRDNPALHHNSTLRFYEVDNERILLYGKLTADLSNIILVVVNLDPHHTQSGWTDLPLEELGISARETIQAHDLLSDAHYLWQGPRNFVSLNPQESPAQIYRIRRRVRTERDFDYFL